MARTRKSRKTKRSKVDVVRYAILGGLGLVLATVLVYSLLYATGLVGNTQNYVELEDRELKTDPLEVVEYFSFQCPHCQALDPEILDWASELPENVRFRQVHVGYTSTAQNLARAFLTLTHLGAIDENRERLFAEATIDSARVKDAESIADLVDGHGVSKEQFLNLFVGGRIEEMFQNSEAEVREYGVTSVPLVLIGDKYAVSPAAGHQQMLRTIERLVRESLNPSQEDSAEPEEEPESGEEAVPEQEPELGET